MQAGDCHAALIIEPDNDPASGRADACMVGAGNRVSLPAAHNNNKGLEWACVQILAHFSNHNFVKLPETASECKRLWLQGFRANAQCHKLLAKEAMTAKTIPNTSKPKSATPKWPVSKNTTT